MYQQKVIPVCVVCNEIPPGGFTSGIFINRRFICQTCERAILKSSAGDKSYHEIIQRLKRIWL